MAFDIPTLALACLVLLAISYAVLGLLTLVPQTARTARETWPILITETVIAGLVAAAFWAGGWFLTAALILHAARISYESAKVAGVRARLPAPIGISIAVTAASACAALMPIPIVAAAALLTACAAIPIRRRMRDDTRRAAVLLDLLIFPLLPLMLFTAAGLQDGFGIWLLAAFILVEIFDSCALLGGKLFGRRTAFPSLSPNKTVEGLLVGAAMLALIAAIAAPYLLNITFAAAAGMAVAAGALAVAGDLAASHLKRLSGVKDFPPIMKRQGGLLDITDAWIAAGAGIVLLSPILPSF